MTKADNKKKNPPNLLADLEEMSRGDGIRIIDTWVHSIKRQHNSNYFAVLMTNAALYKTAIKYRGWGKSWGKFQMVPGMISLFVLFVKSPQNFAFAAV